jgi:hypothetical protein
MYRIYASKCNLHINFNTEKSYYRVLVTATIFTCGATLSMQKPYNTCMLLLLCHMHQGQKDNMQDSRSVGGNDSRAQILLFT